MANRSECILVLGTHRSGTSITTALVQQLGYELGGPLLFVGDENPHGHFEHVTVLTMHEAFLAEMGREWSDPLSDLLAAAGRARRRRWRAEIEGAYREITRGTSRFALKDPRMVHFLPLWWSAFRRLGVHGSAIVTMRDPQSTVRSLVARNALDIAHAERIWMDDVLAIRRGMRRHPHGIVRYEQLLDDPSATMHTAFAAAGLAWQPDVAGLTAPVDPSLNRSGTRPNVTLRHAAEYYAAIEPLASVTAWPTARPASLS